MEKYFNKALELDKLDILAGFRYNFVNDEDLIYLDGNSLGKLPVVTAELIQDLTLSQWGERLIRSWNEGWIDLPQRIAAKIALVIGAGEDEVFVGDSTTLNLFKLAFAALKANNGKKNIISDTLNFPADLYVLQGLINDHFKGHKLIVLESPDGISADTDSIIDSIDGETALATFSYVAYKSSFMNDMERINARAREKGCLVIWDLSHASGAVPVSLNETGADMAVGCTYKYLNGGPGAPAFLYVRKDLQDKMINPVSSWFAHKKPFDFDLGFTPAPGINKFAVGTPPVISMAAIEPGLDLILEAGIDNLRRKSLVQSRFLIDMIKEFLLPLGFKMGSPYDDETRGSHVSVRHKDGYRIYRALTEPRNGAITVIPDFRPPDNIRLGIAPLYNCFMDLFYTVERLREIALNEEFKNFDKERLKVT